jgi:hypothetical protein
VPRSVPVVTRSAAIDVIAVPDFRRPMNVWMRRDLFRRRRGSTKATGALLALVTRNRGGRRGFAHPNGDLRRNDV